MVCVGVRRYRSPRHNHIRNNARRHPSNDLNAAELWPGPRVDRAASARKRQFPAVRLGEMEKEGEIRGSSSGTFTRPSFLWAFAQSISGPQFLTKKVLQNLSLEGRR